MIGYRILFLIMVWTSRVATRSAFVTLLLGLRRERAALEGACAPLFFLFFAIPSLSLIYFSKWEALEDHKGTSWREWKKPLALSPFIRLGIASNSSKPQTSSMAILKQHIKLRRVPLLLVNGEKEVKVLFGPSAALKLGDELSIELLERADRVWGSLAYQAWAASMKVTRKELYIKALDSSCSIMRVLKLSRWSQGSVEPL